MKALSLLGAGEILGGNIIGPIRDKLGNKFAYVVEIMFLVAAISLVISVNRSNEFGYTSFLMCFVWGLQDSGLNCLIRCVLGFEFDDKQIPFSIFNFVQSLFIFAI